MRGVVCALPLAGRVWINVRYNIVNEADLEHAAFKVDQYLADKTVTVSVTVGDLAGPFRDAKIDATS